MGARPVPLVVHDEQGLRTLWRRLRWRAHWALHPNEPLILNPWWDGMTLILPRSGSAATAFYRTFPSQAIASWMSQALRPGMTVVDVGAHIGVYSILAARLVAPEGRVHAIEPQQACAELIDRNGARNGLTNVTTHTLALGDADGEVELLVDQRTMGGLAGSARTGATTPVSARRLQTFVAEQGIQHVDLVKLDAAGNEFAVLAGAGALLGDAISTVVCKLYHPDTVTERFGTRGVPAATLDLLRNSGYELTLADGQVATRAVLDAVFADGRYSTPLLAKMPERSRE